MRPTPPLRRRQCPRRAPPTRARLAVEPLEDRITPITNGALDGIGHPNVGAFEVIRAPTDLPDLQVPRIIGSGTLIHPRVFLTAGHVTAVVEQRLANGTAKLDDLRVSFAPDAFDERSWLAISGVITHPGFRDIPDSAGAQVGSDIGVVILQRPVITITPATLPPPGFLDALKGARQLQAGRDATSFTVVGYGSQLDVPPPEVVPPDGLRRVAQSAYRSLQQEWLTVSQQFATGLGGTGYGDSGGPTFWVDPATGRETLVSLTSRGDIPLVSNGVTYRVDISPSLDFINSVIAQVESGSGGGALLASGTAPAARAESLRLEHIAPLLSEALGRWQGAGADVSGLISIDIRIVDLAGATFGLASGRTIWLDVNAAGWGWFVDPTPWDDSEFTTPGNQGEQNRMDLLTVLAHEVGHLLGYEHEEDGVMQETLSAGERLTLHSTNVNDYSWLIGLRSQVV